VNLKNAGINITLFFDKRLARGKAKQDVFINTIKEQKEILRRKSCSCFSDSIKNKNKAV
jgi:hypothetical protein